MAQKVFGVNGIEYLFNWVKLHDRDSEKQNNSRSFRGQTFEESMKFDGSGSKPNNRQFIKSILVRAEEGS